MKIAIFTDTYPPHLNGVATYVDYLARKLYSEGHTVYLFAPKVKGYKDKENYVYRLPSIRALPNLPDFVRLPLAIPHKNFWKIISFDFDIVHSHGNGAFSLLGLAVAKTKKVPYILTFHTQLGQYAHYFFKGKIIKPKMINDLLRRFANLCDGIITPSQKMKDELIKAGVAKNIEVIPNFVDPDKFNIRRKSGYLRKFLDIKKNCPILLAVGRLGKEKNFEFLLEVFKEIESINKNCHLVLVGEGVEHENLKNLGAKLNLNGRFHMTGAIPIDDMPKVYADCDIFVFPSVSEVHPMVAIEAAASGLPLVVAQDKAYEGIVVNGRNGFVLPLNQKVFAKKILQLLEKPNLSERLGKNSKILLKEAFDPKLLISKIIKFYYNFTV